MELAKFIKTELLKSISFLLLSVGKKVCNVSAVVETVCAYTVHRGDRENFWSLAIDGFSQFQRNKGWVRDQTGRDGELDNFSSFYPKNLLLC